MDPFDKNQTDPVWERVLGSRFTLTQETFARPRPPFPWLEQARAEDEFARGCQALARRMTGPHRQNLLSLQRQAASRAACLRSMGREAGELRQARPMASGGRPVTLDQLQRQARQLVLGYEDGRDHPAWGPVLAQFQRETLRALGILQAMQRRGR